MAATTTGPDFVSFQVRDRAVSAEFYDKLVGLTRLPDSNRGDRLLRRKEPRSPSATRSRRGSRRDPSARRGIGVWFHNDDAERVHARLVDAGVAIVQEPVEGPFGLQFSFRDPDGYVVTIHARA
jgi:predicted enzyme related to lactoylglutathione lyase